MNSVTRFYPQFVSPKLPGAPDFLKEKKALKISELHMKIFAILIFLQNQFENTYEQGELES